MPWKYQFSLLEIIIVGRNLGIGVIVCEFNGMLIFHSGWIMISGFPKAEMLQNLPNNRLVLNHADDLHFSPAFGSYQWIDFIYLLYQPRPVSATSLSDRSESISAGTSLSLPEFFRRPRDLLL